MPGSDIRSPRLVVCAHELLAIGARERARFISVRPEHVLLVKARIGQRIAQLSQGIVAPVVRVCGLDRAAVGEVEVDVADIIISTESSSGGEESGERAPFIQF